MNVWYQCTLLNFQTPFSSTYSFSYGPSAHVAPLAVLAELNQRAPPAFGRAAVVGYVHDALQDDVVVQLAGFHFAAHDAAVELAYPRLPDIHTQAPKLGVVVAGSSANSVPISRLSFLST